MTFRRSPSNAAGLILLLLTMVPAAVWGQARQADYERADSFDARTRGLVVDVAQEPHWIGETSRFWYRKSVEGGNQFVLVDPSTLQQLPAFDHKRVAASLSVIRGDTLTGAGLPFANFEFADDGQAIEFTLSDSTWECSLVDYECSNSGPVPDRSGRPMGSGRHGSRTITSLCVRWVKMPSPFSARTARRATPMLAGP